MAFRDWGNPPIYSTTAESQADPSTATLIAERQVLTDNIYEVRFVVGASTGALWKLEHASSTSLSTASVRRRIMAFTGSNQSSEFILTFKAEANDIFRIVAQSSFTGTAAGAIEAEILT